MTITEARELFAYCAWANGRLFAAAEALTPEQLHASVASSFPSLLRTLAHIVSAEWIWLRRWEGESPSAAPAWVKDASLSEVRGHLAAVEADRNAFLANLTDRDLERTVDYRTLAGQAQADPLKSLFRHVVNHSTYHRGQAATQIRQLGLVPPGTDLTLYLREQR